MKSSNSMLCVELFRRFRKGQIVSVALDEPTTFILERTAYRLSNGDTLPGETIDDVEGEVKTYQGKYLRWLSTE
jgi:hypothetical protein